VDVVEKRRTSSGWGGMATVGAALGGLALLLGLKRRRDRRREEDKDSVSYYDSYYSSNYTSASELS
jgi:LPXTG-motif cell wall-anchored protein